jgi:hypothetical protein
MVPPCDDERRDAAGEVLSSVWEDALRAGQREDGGGGSVENELAVVHLLRHARAPEELGADDLERIWRDVARQTSPTPWWRRRWVLLGGPLAVSAAAAAVLLVVAPGEPESTGASSVVARPNVAGPMVAGPMVARPNVAGPMVAGPNGMREALRRQFAALEPAGRARLASAVDAGRSRLRGQLLALSTLSDAGEDAP